MAVGVSVWTFPLGAVDQQLALIVVLTVLSSTVSQIQLPGVKVHITLSDVLIFLALIMYGGAIATLLAAIESVSASLGFHRRGISITGRTVFLNGAIAAISTFCTSLFVNAVLGSPASISISGDFSHFVVMLSVLALSLFAVNSLFVTIFTSIKSGRSLWEIWYVNCLTGLILYFTSSFIAGILAKAFYRLDTPLTVIGLFSAGLIYFTFWRYINQVKRTAAVAEHAERERAELAEKHVAELKNLVAEKEIAEIALTESREKFRHAAFHDALTGLPNKNSFLKTLTELLGECRVDPGRKFAVLYLDLNRFKRINDSLGHSTGDQLLLKVAKRLSAIDCDGKTVARFSGDEFGIIVDRIDAPETAMDLAYRIRDSISGAFSVDGKRVFTSVSIGIVVGDSSYDEAENLVRDSDIAMYHAKEAKRDVVLFDKQMHEKAVNLLEIETDLRYAVERRELVLFYQPIICLDSLELRGFEALVRWNHPIRGLIPPNDFIPVCESTGLIVPLTRWVLNESARQLVEWNETYDTGQPLFVSVNLSGRHFDDPDIVNHVQEVLDRTGIDPAKLRLELTESAVMENAVVAIWKLEELRQLGIRISIDDFGTGYSTLSYLHRFPINTVKIDRSFISGIGDKFGNEKIVSTIVAMARALGLDVIAEGVETIDQMEQLRQLGCELGQGYLFAKPVPANEAGTLIDSSQNWTELLPAPVTGTVRPHISA